MSDKKYVVPREMLDAAIAGYARCVGTGSLDRFGVEWAVESALKWLAENPFVPTPEQIEEIVNPPFIYGRVGVGAPGADVVVLRSQINNWTGEQRLIAAWQKLMFLAPDMDEPIRDLIYPSPAGIPVVLSDSSVAVSKCVNDRIREAFRRGQKVSSK